MTLHQILQLHHQQIENASSGSFIQVTVSHDNTRLPARLSCPIPLGGDGVNIELHCST